MALCNMVKLVTLGNFHLFSSNKWEFCVSTLFSVILVIKSCNKSTKQLKLLKVKLKLQNYDLATN